jgi:ferric-dicitrate binding protein FerR (iron transport regulator)
MVSRAVAFSAVAFAAMLAQQSAAAPTIGLASAVSNQVSGTTGGAPKPIRTGDAVFQDQTVQTAARSSAQLLFRDQTALTVGPASRVKLDRFVYDPNRRTGDIVINATKGAFRFVSGAARSSSYKIRTPVASIAVRGTIFDTFIALEATVAVLVEGSITVCARGSRRCVPVSRPGEFAIVRANGQVSGPHRWDGALWDVNVGVPFPLFGRRQANDFSDQSIRPNDVRDAIDNGGLAQPPSTGDGGGGGGVVIP